MKPKDQQTITQQDNSELSKETIDSIKKEKSQFIGHLVHNLKNPIGSALSFSDMIMEDIDSYSPEKLKRHLNIIKSSCEAALNQLDLILLETRIEINNIDLNLQKTVFLDLIKNCLAENEKNFQKNNFNIQTSFYDEEYKINLDRTLIKHSLHGLFQFLLLCSGNNANLKIELKPENDLMLLRIETNQSNECDEKIENFNFENSCKNNKIFNQNQGKFLKLKDIFFIAQKHNGFFTLTKNELNSLVLTFALSAEL